MSELHYETSKCFQIKNGLRVLVTAGARGIGLEIAETFAAQGANVYVCDVSSEAIDSWEKNHPGTGFLTDVSEESQVARLYTTLSDTSGGLDVLVNNAGIAGPTDKIENIGGDKWRRTVDVNLNGMFYQAKFATPMLKLATGHMINISSVAGRLGYAYRSPYAATKWAVIGLTLSLAKELGPDGVRVNAVLPGIVQGGRIEDVISARAKALKTSYQAVETTYLENVSLRRMISAKDIANMVLFLCTPAGQNISGQALSVCGNVETL